MIKFSQPLQVALVGLGWLAVCAAVYATVIVGLIGDSSLGLRDIAGQIGLVIVMFVLFGLFPITLYGAPLYALLERKGRANWLTAFGIGALPGLLLVGFSHDLGMAATLAGTAVAVLTHFVRRQRV